MDININRTVDWEGASAVDIQRLLEDVVTHLTCNLSTAPSGRIIVSFQPNNPKVLFRHCSTDPYHVLLSVKGRPWDQYAYQFAHEFCHIICKYDKLQKLPNKWFHETICEVASLFVLKRMAITWISNPPYDNWKNYAQCLDSYADNRIADLVHHLPVNVTLSEWLRDNKLILRSDCEQRTMNTLVAIQLLPLFQAAPEHWESVRYLPNSSGNFSFFLYKWQTKVPKKHKAFVQAIASKLLD